MGRTKVNPLSEVTDDPYATFALSKEQSDVLDQALWDALRLYRLQAIAVSGECELDTETHRSNVQALQQAIGRAQIADLTRRRLLAETT